METETGKQSKGKTAGDFNFTLRQKHIFCLMGILSDLDGKHKPQANKTAVVERKIIATFNNKQKPNDLYDDVCNKLNKLSNNPDWPLPLNVLFISLSTYQTNITALDTAIKERAAKTITKEDLQRACKLVISNTQNLKAMIQLKLDANIPDEAKRICQNSGFEFKSLVVRGPGKSYAKPAIEPGKIILHGTDEGYHEWQQSEDGGLTFVYIQGSTGCKNVAGNLVSDKKYWFRWRLVLTKGRFGPWSQWFWCFAP